MGEVSKPWRKPTDEQGFLDGDQILVAYQVLCPHSSKPKSIWRYQVLTVHCDEHFFGLERGEGGRSDLELSDINCWLPLSEFSLQAFEETPVHLETEAPDAK